MDHAASFKEICAHFGAAMYYAQCLEHGIANALVLLDLLPRTAGRWTDEEYDGFYDRNFEKTLGNLVKHLKSVTSIPQELEVALEASRKKRAFLAHNFFRERNDAFFRREHAAIIAELEAMRAFFEQTDRQLDRFMQPLMHQHGFTELAMEQALAEYKRHIGAASGQSE